MIRISFLIVMFLILALPASAKSKWNVQNNHYNPSDSPIEIVKIESHWQDYRRPRYNQYGNRLKKELLPGIWCKVHFKVPKEDEGGKDILAVKFGIWYFNAFDELLGAYSAYTRENDFRIGKQYDTEWLTQDDLLGSTHYRTIIYPFEIRFADNSWWIADPEEILKWFIKTMEWGNELMIEDLFPEDEFGTKEDWEKKLIGA